MNWFKDIFGKKTSHKLRDPLAYAIAEGFMEIPYWPSGNPTSQYSGTVGCQFPFTESDHAVIGRGVAGKTRIIVLGVEYYLSDDFFVKYGLRMDDYESAIAYCRQSSHKDIKMS